MTADVLYNRVRIDKIRLRNPFQRLTCIPDNGAHPWLVDILLSKVQQCNMSGPQA